MRMEVVCVGIFTVDAVGRTIDKFPEHGKLVLFDKLELHNGGCAMNTALALGKLGVRVGVAGKVGDDSFAGFLEKTLDEHHVNRSMLVRDTNSSTGFTFACVGSSGERAFLHAMGANATLRVKDLEIRKLLNTSVLHVAGFNLMPGLDGGPMAGVLKRAKKAGVITCLDTVCNDRIKDWLAMVKPCLPYLSYFMPSYEEAVRISGVTDVPAMAHFFLSLGVEKAVIKLGSKGSYYSDGKEEVSLPCFDVKTVDTTGAGDAFAGGFLYGVLNRMDPRECLRWGSAVAAQCVSAMGASAGLKDLASMKRWLKTARLKEK